MTSEDTASQKPLCDMSDMHYVLSGDLWLLAVHTTMQVCTWSRLFDEKKGGGVGGRG